MAINLTNFINEVDLDYPRDEVFKIFRKQAKQDFPRFNEKEAIGTSTRKKIGAYSTRTAQAYLEISDYIPNEVYEVTVITSKTNTTFKSRYELKDLENGGTHLTLIQDQGTPGVFTSINTIIQKLLFKGRVNKKFDYLVEGLKREIEGERKRINPKYVSPYDSEVAADENSKIEDQKESVAP
ncbi:DUF3284 domain-containing protein [Clostridium massiliamazoniense]|uniref:DUF3284 domain-containing protein n=1 Tax=Clostridium massiliamazoniense TaxID=1347366 RepID=UPI0006D7DC35|nr:DUF3284 domain-containing protein [Clostridium massiliamazoniense]